MKFTGSPAVSPALSRSAAALARHYLEVRHTTESLCADLSADDQMVQPMPDASPAKWHQAHTTWFFETFILSSYLPKYRPFNQHFRFLFNSYYKQVETPEENSSTSHPLRAIRGTFSRPTLDEVRAYRHYVDEHMQRLLETTASSAPELISLLELGINHEQQHQELIVTDIKYAFWTNPLRPAYVNRPLEETRANVPPLQWTGHAGGLLAIGHDGDGFAFDNESPRHKVYLEPFRIASRPVTNREFLDFMNDGGYRRPELWLSDGWDAVQTNRWAAPLYWEHHGSDWRVFTAGGTREVRWDEPVSHVSYYEADAYARWAGARLPSEAEWEVVASALQSRASSVAGNSHDGNFLDDGRFHPAPAPNVDGIVQLLGDVWEWTASPYVAYPGFRPAAGALGEYNGKFMCSQLVLRGGSCATPRSHIRATYRNFFPPHARWQFSGIRLAK